MKMRIHLTCGRGWTFTLRPAAPPWVAELCSCLSWFNILLVKQHYYHQHKHLDQNMNTFCVQRNTLFVRKPICYYLPCTHCTSHSPLPFLALSQWSCFIGTKSDHCLALSVTSSLSQTSCGDLFDVTLACEDHITSQKVTQTLLALLYRTLSNQLLKFGPRFEAELLSRFRSTFTDAQYSEGGGEDF